MASARTYPIAKESMTKGEDGHHADGDENGGAETSVGVCLVLVGENNNKYPDYGSKREWMSARSLRKSGKGSSASSAERYILPQLAVIRPVYRC